MHNDSKAAERVAFDNVPELYDRVRPSYPAPLFDEMFRYLREGVDTAEPRVVEVGPGTGKATVVLLERGARVTAVEIGPEMSAFLRRKFANEARLEVINAPFEDAELAPDAYDLVVSATAFHWIDPLVRFVKSRDVLRPDGALAVVMTNQIASDVDRGFFDRTFPIYLKYRPDEQNTELPGESVVPVEHDDMQSSGLFDDVTLHRYRWDQTYPTDSYADLVRSYSATQMMEPGPREELIADLCGVIDREYGGSVTRPLVMTLTLGRSLRANGRGAEDSIGERNGRDGVREAAGPERHRDAPAERDRNGEHRRADRCRAVDAPEEGCRRIWVHGGDLHADWEGHTHKQTHRREERNGRHDAHRRRFAAELIDDGGRDEAEHDDHE